MARILLSTGTLVGRRMLSITAQVIQLTGDISRIKAIVDQITAGGLTPALLESSLEGGVPAGQGAAVYAGIQSLQAAVAGLAVLVAELDQG